MPTNNPKKVAEEHFSRRKNLFLCIFLACVSVAAIVFVIVGLSQERILSAPDSNQKKVSITANPPSIAKPSVRLSKNISAKDDEWCEARDYEDLSTNPVFEAFSTWALEYQKLQCKNDLNCSLHLHDPRRLRSFYNMGYELAVSRSKVLTKIIRGDPQKALTLALDQTVIDSMPPAFEPYLENWLYDYVDFEAMHVCYDPAHPAGLIKRHSTLSTGERLRTWTFGQRKKMPTVKGLSVWGVRMGSDFAMSDKPYREKITPLGEKLLLFGDLQIPYSKEYEKEFFTSEIAQAERRAGKLHGFTMPYPKIASSLGLTEYYDRKYDFNSSLSTWQEANQSASLEGGRLVSIDSQQEQSFIQEKLKEIGIDGFDHNGNRVKYSWIGASDDGSQFAMDWNSTSQSYDLTPLGASEGDWRWLFQGALVSSGFSNWIGGGNGPSNSTYTGQDYAVLNWGADDGHWLDVNDSYLLPFVIEYDNMAEPATLSVAVNGYKKVLVIPARFQDEGYNYNGSSVPLVDQFGQPLFPELQQDSFEPVSNTDLHLAMEEVKAFFLRNSDQSFYLEPVISPTVTMPVNKFDKVRQSSSGNLFDTGGQFYTFTEPEYEALGELDQFALIEAADLGDDYHFGGPAFQGILRFDFTSPLGTNFEEPPVITIKGGNINPANGRVHQNFSIGKAEAILDEMGRLTAINISDPGAYYFSEPSIFLDDQNFSDQIDVVIDNICVSYLIITTYGSGGLGYVGGPGSHVSVSEVADPAAGDSWKFVASSGVIAHELGHNFNQHHSNTNQSLSERPNSDEVLKYEYNHPHSVMGSGGNISYSGDFTIIGKVGSKLNGNFGLTIGNSIGNDVAWLSNENDLLTTPLSLQEDGLPDNTFRIFRHDWGYAPLSLLEGFSFTVELPENARNQILDSNDSKSVFSVAFVGTGYGAHGVLDLDNNELTISHGGIGYADNPKIEILDDLNTTIITLDPSWVRVQSGTNYSEIASLRNFADSSSRGLRGVALPAGQYGSRGIQNFGFGFDTYWLEYRSDIASNGIFVSMGSNPGLGFAMDDALLDMSMETPNNFGDAELLIGKTYSDYDSDIHITPISNGGTSPMDYIDIVINMGTVSSGDVQAPGFTLDISNQFPEVGEFVGISVLPTTGSTSDYAYSWFTNEDPETDTSILNQPTISKAFNASGEYAVRVLVSDMKGGLASRNIVFKVGDYHKNFTSSVSGTVRSTHGNIQGARVEITPAPVIEHQVDIVGDSRNYFLPTGTASGVSYRMDNVKSKDLFLRRGEKHRFVFDQTTKGFPLSFFTRPKPELPTFRMKMLFTPRIEEPGSIYTEPPEITVTETGAFANYLDHRVGTIADFHAGLMGNATAPLVIQRPYAKSLLIDTSVDKILTRPSIVDPDTGLRLQYGGLGLSRNNAPNAFVRRASFWEDFVNDRNATAKAYVDGVGTISPVNSTTPGAGEHNFLKSTWYPRTANSITPDLLVWGSVSTRNFADDSLSTNYSPSSNVSAKVITEPTDSRARRIVVENQGFDWEPNSTMAVLHYPKAPLAYWTFDVHESLFDDASESRFQPSPGWNRPTLRGLTGYWQLDEENGSTLSDGTGNQAAVTMASNFDLADENRSDWGTLGRAVELNGTADLTFPNVLDDSNFTFSAWLKPSGDFTLSVGGANNITYDASVPACSFGGETIPRISPLNQWMHIAVVATSTGTGFFYVDGQKAQFTSGVTFFAGGSITTTDFTGLVDEVRYFDEIKEESEVKELAGRSFLDLSGNKFHLIPVQGSDPSALIMSDPSTDTGISLERPADNSNPNTPGALGDSFPGENHGRSIVWDNGDSHHLDLTNHRNEFAGINRGTIAFWIRTDGVDDDGEKSDLTIFSASNIDNNKSFFRIMLRDIGVMQLECYNDGIEVAKFYTTSDGRISTGSEGDYAGWAHVAFIADDNKSSFWINGVQRESLAYVGGEGDKRAFFSDVENINYIGIGLHQTLESNATSYFRGYIDDFYMYDRALSSSEINYLIGLKAGRESLPRLEALVDAVGTVKVLDSGEGYKEKPDTVFSYGQEKNTTGEDIFDVAQLDQNFTNPIPGDLAFSDSRNVVMTYHHSGGGVTTTWRKFRDIIPTTGNFSYSDANQSGWRAYKHPVGNALLIKTGIDRVLWTQDTRETNALVLPDGRTIYRRYVEYVEEGNNSTHFLSPIISPNYNKPNFNFSAPKGLFGYKSPPDLSPEGGSESGGSAKIYTLMFSDKNETPVITTAGRGLVRNNFDPTQIYRFFGEGYQPEQGETINVVNADGTSSTINSVLKNAQNVAENGTVQRGLNNEYYFNDYNHNTGMGEPRDFYFEINKSVSHVSVLNPGFGYSVPVEVKLIGGYPTVEDLVDHVANTGGVYNFTPAEVSVATIDQNGSILTFQIDDAGSGYLRAPEVVITGGGGYAALAFAEIDPGGKIDSVEIIPGNGGRGYFNIDPNNTPKAEFPAVGSGEENATLNVRLGGSVESVDPADNYYPSGDLLLPLPRGIIPNNNPWIEIWDLERTEAEIDQMHYRALAVPKVRNGVIEKVIVVKSGKGYRDPVIYVRGGAPQDIGRGGGRRWRCMNQRETLLGDLEICGHIESGLYPPESCPGEVVVDANLSEERTEEVKFDWLGGHLAPLNNNRATGRGPFPAPPALSWGPYSGEPSDWVTRYGGYQGPVAHRCTEHEEYACASHLGMSFASRVCSGKKSNFKLLNDPYRTPYETWEPYEAKLVPLVEDGKIIEIRVENGGSMYAADEVAVAGSGGAIDVIPVFGADGNFISLTYEEFEQNENYTYNHYFSGEDLPIPNYIFDDPRLRNTEIDIVQNPIGAGQGFQERTWSRDGFWIDHEIAPYQFVDNVPTRGPAWKGELPTMHAWMPIEGELNLKSPALVDILGDRVVGVDVLHPGKFEDSRTIEGQELVVDFTAPTNFPDLNKDGVADFIEARTTIHETFSLTEIILDQNSSWQNGTVTVGGVQRDVWRALYDEEPLAYSITNENLVDNLSMMDLIRLNGTVEYDVDSSKTYLDLYIDDNFPSDFYYGFGDPSYASNPGIGGKVFVTEGMPGMNFDKTNNSSPLVRRITSFTDQNGFYSISGLEPGLYNVSVYMEDQNLQESTFRPESNSTHVSETIYIAGIPVLTMESDQVGVAKSSMIWSMESRRLARPADASVDENQREKKILEGVGAGFEFGSQPELIITPGSENLGQRMPKMNVTVNLDGSLNLEIIDDVETTLFNPGDKFTVSFATTVSGVDFREDFLFGNSQDTSWGGSAASSQIGVPRIVIYPNDGNSTNYVEVPLSTETYGDKIFSFHAVAYDANGFLLDTDNVSWSLDFGFNAVEGDDSMLGTLSTTDGNTTNLTLRSTLRRGKLESLQVVVKGRNYTSGSRVRAIGKGAGFEGTILVDSDGGIISVNVSDSGSGYNQDTRFVIDDLNGTGAYLKAVVRGGVFNLNASLDTGAEVISTKVGLLTSLRQPLTLREEWLDKYLDTIDQSTRTNAWWAGDDDGDGLSNEQEYTLDTNPLMIDSDDDGMSDFEETDSTARYMTNPRVADTDGDGVSDYEENATYNSNPLLIDTDGDGYTDREEIVLGTDLLVDTQLSNLSGLIYRKGNFTGDLILELKSSNADITDELPEYENTLKTENFGNVVFPYFFSFSGLVSNKHYHISAFIDSNGNGLIDSSEMFAEWEAPLTQNLASVKLTLEDVPPTLEFLDNITGVQQIDRGESFTLSVMAFDFPDDNWTITSAVAPRSITVSGSAIDQNVVDIAGDIVSVRTDATFGNYQLELIAQDVAGSTSDLLVREIEIIDMMDPTITLLLGSGATEDDTYKWRYGEDWNASALRNQAFIVKDFPSGVDLTMDVEKTTITGTIDSNTLGVYEIVISATDESGRNSLKTLQVEVTDQTPPEISFIGDDTLVLLLGSEFSLPPNIVTVNDNLDGDLTANIQVFGVESLDPNSTDSQFVTFQAVDSSGNPSTSQLEVLFEKPGFTISGFAIDGYLAGSQIQFIPASSELQHLTRTVITNSSGGFELDFLSSEFQLLDANNNGLLDLDEGTLQATGGIDSTTNREFTGLMKADPGATVLTPLTTVVHALMEDGATKEEAIQATANSFGFSAQIDITNFDPIQAAGIGEEDAKKVLQAGALVANMMKQAEVLSDIANLDAVEGEASLAMAQDLASLVSQNMSLPTVLAQASQVELSLNRSFNLVDSSSNVSATELSQFSNITTSSNQAISDSSLLQLEPGAMVGQLAKRQIAVEEEVLVELEKVASGTASLSGLLLNTDVGSLIEVADSLPAFNQFAPVGTSFDVYMTEDLFQENVLVRTLDVSDPDGDVVSISLGSGNIDLDGDGLYPFALSNNQELRVADAFDLKQLSGSDSNLSIILSDVGGKTTTIFARLKAVGESNTPVSASLFNATSNGAQGWFSSPWMGHFYAVQDDWFFHSQLGWLYLQPNANGGFWFWDSLLQGWCWSNETVFPYSFLQEVGKDPTWIYYDLDTNPMRIYNFTNQQWTAR